MSWKIKPNDEKTLIKLLALPVLAMYFVFDYNIVKDIDAKLLFVYCLVMFSCSLSIFFSIFSSARKISYLILGLSFAIYLAMRNFIPEISDAINSVDCLEVGKVWDGEQKICRTDCLTWNKEQGCVRE